MLFGKGKPRTSFVMMMVIGIVMVMALCGFSVFAENINDNFNQNTDGWIAGDLTAVSLVDSPSASDKSMQILTTFPAGQGAGTYLPMATKTLAQEIQLATGEQLVVEFKLKVNRTFNSRQCFSINSERPLFYFSNPDESPQGGIVAHDNVKIPSDGRAYTANTNALTYNPTTDSEKWYHFKLILSPAGTSGGTYIIYIDGKKMGVYNLPTYGSNLNFSLIKNVSFRYHVPSNPAAQQSMSMTVNDFKLYANPLDLSASSIANDATNVALNSSLTLDFNNELNSSAVNKNNILVTSNQDSSINYNVTLQNNNGLYNRCLITFPDGLDSATRYVVSFKEGLKSVSGNPFADTQKQIAFTTVAANGHTSDFYSFENEITSANTVDKMYSWSTSMDITSARAHSGKNSIRLSADNQYISVTYPANPVTTNKVVTIWVYDEGYTNANKQFYVSVDNGDIGGQNGMLRGIGVHNGMSTAYYVYRIGATTTVSTVPRTIGWHQFKWIQTNTGLTGYIDGQQIFSDTQTSFKTIQIMDAWGANPGIASDAFYFDDLEVRDVTAADFKLIFSTPANNAINVSTEQAISLDFNQAISQSTLDNIVVSIMYNGVPWEINTNKSLVEVDGVLKRCLISFEDILAEDTTYIVEVKPSLRDINGTRLDNPQTITFSTLKRGYSFDYRFYKDYGTSQQEDITEDSLYSGDITCRVTAAYTDLPTWEASLALALYKGDKLANVRFVNYPNITETTKELIATLNIPTLDDGDYKLKALVWKNMNSIQPLSSQTLEEAPIRIACVGDSLTFGYGATLAYPQRMDLLFGEGYEVVNFGDNGTTLLKSGNEPYVNQTAYLDLKNYNPKYIVIMLGSNDTKTVNYTNIANYEADYKSMIAELSALRSNPTIILCRPAPIIGPTTFDVDNTRLVNGVLPQINKVASDLGLTVIDVYSAFDTAPNKASLYTTDNAHLNDLGAQFLAQTIYNALITVIGGN